ncbi:rod shape-determining protein MreD [Acidobacteriota bacterium]
MKDLLKVAIGLVIAFISYTLLEWLSVSVILICNVFTLIVLYFAMKGGETKGAVVGMFFGLVQDSFSIGVFGIAGIAKTIMGFIAGFIAKRISVVVFRRNFVFIFIMTGIDLIIWVLLYVLLLSENINTGRGLLFFQPLGTAVIGSVVLFLVRKIQNIREQRR